METTNEILCCDTYEMIKQLPDNSIDLIITDPPYEYNNGKGGGAFGSDKRSYHAAYANLDNEDNAQVCKGFDLSLLDEMIRVMKKVNIYIWCSKAQVGKLLNYFESRGYFTDILVWCKTNPTPLCNGTYLSNIEYCVFAREKGVKIYGNYQSKFKHWITPLSVKDKKKFLHPTIKPLDIIAKLIFNSSQEGDVILDPFVGSGTTCVAAKLLGRNSIGFEIDQKYVDIGIERVKNCLDEKEKLSECVLK